MKDKLAGTALLSIACTLLAGCATIPPTPDSPISLPVSFTEVYYRPTLAKPGFLVMTDTGTVTVRTNGVAFTGKKSTTEEITYEKIQHLSFGKVGSDFINNWVTVKYRDGERDSYALFSGGKNVGPLLGWGGVGVAARIFQSIRFALDQKGLGSVVEK